MTQASFYHEVAVLLNNIGVELIELESPQEARTTIKDGIDVMKLAACSDVRFLPNANARAENDPRVSNAEQALDRCRRNELFTRSQVQHIELPPHELTEAHNSVLEYFSHPNVPNHPLRIVPPPGTGNEIGMISAILLYNMALCHLAMSTGEQCFHTSALKCLKFFQMAQAILFGVVFDSNEDFQIDTAHLYSVQQHQLQCTFIIISIIIHISNLLGRHEEASQYMSMLVHFGDITWPYEDGSGNIEHAPAA